MQYLKRRGHRGYFFTKIASWYENSLLFAERLDDIVLSQYFNILLTVLRQILTDVDLVSYINTHKIGVKIEYLHSPYAVTYESPLIVT